MSQNININKYFDYIYCLNLNKRADSWKVVYKRFKKHGIRANRFSAVNGALPVNVNIFNKYSHLAYLF